MSDDDHLGRICVYIPRKTYLYGWAVLFTLYGGAVVLYYVLYLMTNQGTMRLHHDHQGGSQMLTCENTKKSSFHLRMCIMSCFSLYFGIKGINALGNKYAGETFEFGLWMMFVALANILIIGLDTGYMLLCTNAYTWNMISEAVLWPIKGVPMNCGVKYEVMGLKAYPAHYVDVLVGFNVARFYYCVQFLKSAILFHGAWTTFDLASRFHYGITGLGANFSIEGWKQKLQMKEEIDQVTRSTMNMAQMTFMDFGWSREDLEQMSQPLHGGKGHGGLGRPSYQGKMDPRAYDGFKDDRSNVLL